MPIIRSPVSRVCRSLECGYHYPHRPGSPKCLYTKEGERKNPPEIIVHTDADEFQGDPCVRTTYEERSYD